MKQCGKCKVSKDVADFSTNPQYADGLHKKNSMTHTFVIAECGSSWNFGLDPIGNACRMIEAAKEANANAAKFQWTSDASAMAKRRGLPDSEAMYRRYLQYPVDYLHKFKAKCDEVGIEFMCTVYLIEDIPVIAPLVKRLKVSAYESKWPEFLSANRSTGNPVIVSTNDGPQACHSSYKWLYCVSKYPTPLEELHLSEMAAHDGLSDHTTSVLAGALAVAAGATIIEKHAKILGTPIDNPDFPHSLFIDDWVIHENGHRIKESDFYYYVSNIREAERAM